MVWEMGGGGQFNWKENLPMCGIGWLPWVTTSDRELMAEAQLYQAPDLLSQQLNQNRPKGSDVDYFKSKEHF